MSSEFNTRTPLHLIGLVDPLEYFCWFFRTKVLVGVPLEQQTLVSFSDVALRSLAVHPEHIEVIYRHRRGGHRQRRARTAVFGCCVRAPFDRAVFIVWSRAKRTQKRSDSPNHKHQNTVFSVFTISILVLTAQLADCASLAFLQHRPWRWNALLLPFFSQA